MRVCSSFFFLICMQFIACSHDNDKPLPNYEQGLVNAQTSVDGSVKMLHLDNGKKLAVNNRFVTTLRDTTFRAYALYVRFNEKTKLSRLTEILTCEPFHLADNKVHHDALLLRSVWLGGGYLNFHVSLPSGPARKSHYLGVVDKGVKVSASNVRTLHLQLYHSQNGDGTAYYRDSYFSCRLDSYARLLQPGDTVLLSYVDEKGRWKSLAQTY